MGFGLIILVIPFLFAIKCDAGQLLCASCSDIARPSDCYRHMRCNNDEACPIFHQPFVGKRQQGVHVKCLSCCNDTALCNQDSGCKFPAAAGTTVATVTKVRDCKDVLDIGLVRQDGVQHIDVGTSKKTVYCDMTTAGGGWTVILYRKDSQVDFLHRDSNDYARGFGNKHTDFWQGLEDVRALTSDGRRYQLRVDLQAANRSHFYQIYDDFYIGPAKDFTLHIGSNRGTAGDSLSGHNGFGFTTSDHDVDSMSGANCAKYLGGSWWFHHCYDSCLTCEYVTATPGTQECASMTWNSVRYCEPLRMAKMMIRPM